MHQAYNLFCDAFTLTNGLIGCKALQEANQIPGPEVPEIAAHAAWLAGQVLYPTIEFCQVSIELPVSNTYCADTSGLGHCITNDKTGGIPLHTGCTVHEPVGGGNADAVPSPNSIGGTQQQMYKYKTKMSFTLLQSEAEKSGESIQMAKQITKEKLISGDPTTQEQTIQTLQAYMVVSAVKMSDSASISSNLNVTAVFGLSAKELEDSKTAFRENGLTSTVLNPPPSLQLAITSVAATNPSVARAVFDYDDSVDDDMTSSATRASVFEAPMSVIVSTFVMISILSFC